MIFEKKNILVVGDLMLDIYDTGSVRRISPEAPVPVFLKDNRRFVLGGAANVALNMVYAGQKVSICGIVGNDEGGATLLELMHKNTINCDYVVRVSNRCTTTKNRIVAQNNQQIVRIDNEETGDISINQCDDMVAYVEKDIDVYDAIVLSDYKKGLLCEYFCKKIIDISNEHGKKVYIDVKDTNIKKYKNAFLLKPNKGELSMLTGEVLTDNESIEKASYKLIKETECQYVLTTLGSKGMMLCGNGFETCYEETIEKEVFDVSGAGDTALSYFVAANVSGLGMKRSVHYANVAAGIKVSKIGTSPVDIEEVEIEMNRELCHKPASCGCKILTLQEFTALIENNIDQRIVFTNGCFDILHIGHVKYLNEAAKLGDILVVGLNSDESVKRLKGNSRPINSQEDRAGILAGLSCVDYVIVFEDDTPLAIIEAISPNILVKGGEYTEDTIVGADYVRKKGGLVITIPMVEGKSTTHIIDKIGQL